MATLLQRNVLSIFKAVLDFSVAKNVHFMMEKIPGMQNVGARQINLVFIAMIISEPFKSKSRLQVVQIVAKWKYLLTFVDGFFETLLKCCMMYRMMWFAYDSSHIQFPLMCCIYVS